MTAVVPPLRWLRAYRTPWLAGDLVAGITLAAYAIPVSLAYAGLAGLPPEVGLYGYLLGGLGYAVLAHHPEHERLEGALVFRVESSLLYFNVENVRREVLQRAAGEGAALRLVVCDFSRSPHVDLAGARMLQGLQTELASRGVVLRLAEARATVRDLLRAVGLETTVGRIEHGTTVADVLAGAAR